AVARPHRSAGSHRQADRSVAGRAQGLPSLPRQPRGGAGAARARPGSEVHVHDGDPARAHAHHPGGAGEGDLGPRRSPALLQGCGKSLTAKAIASVWSLPLLRLDLGRIFSSLIGSSEENLRRAIRVAESVSPTILWIDEIEKGLAGNAGAAVTDSGVSARVFGSLL